MVTYIFWFAALGALSTGQSYNFTATTSSHTSRGTAWNLLVRIIVYLTLVVSIKRNFLINFFFTFSFSVVLRPVGWIGHWKNWGKVNNFLRFSSSSISVCLSWFNRDWFNIPHSNPHFETNTVLQVFIAFSCRKIKVFIASMSCVHEFHRCGQYCHRMSSRTISSHTHTHMQSSRLMEMLLLRFLLYSWEQQCESQQSKMVLTSWATTLSHLVANRLNCPNIFRFVSIKYFCLFSPQSFAHSCVWTIDRVDIHISIKCHSNSFVFTSMIWIFFSSPLDG